MARILLVDDEIEFRQLMLAVLTMENHAVVCASDGNEAIRLFFEGTFDLVITDLVMPEKEGLETIRELRERSPLVKIVAMTGGGYSSASTYLALARAFGVEHTLAKPFSRSDILMAVSSALGSEFAA